MPFLADELWQNLVRGVCPDAPASVHLAGYPQVDAALADARAAGRDGDVRTVVALGHSARNDAGIKLRQPLRAATVVDGRRRSAPRTSRPIRRAGRGRAGRQGGATGRLQRRVRRGRGDAEPASVLGPKYGRDLGMIRGLLREGEFTLDDGCVAVGEWTLEPGEFELRTRAREGFAVVDGDGFAVALDTEITPELRLEGVARDVIRSVQQLRKDAGLDVTDRIVLRYPQADSDAAAAFAAARPVDRRRDARRERRAGRGLARPPLVTPGSVNPVVTRQLRTTRRSCTGSWKWTSSSTSSCDSTFSTPSSRKCSTTRVTSDSGADAPEVMPTGATPPARPDRSPSRRRSGARGHPSRASRRPAGSSWRSSASRSRAPGRPRAASSLTAFWRFWVA